MQICRKNRQQEREFLLYYRYPDYWEGGGLWGMGALPFPPAMALPAAERDANPALPERDVKASEVHLRSTADITGYEIQATDGSIGEVQDFVFDDGSWAVRYLVVDTRKWWPGGRKVLIGVQWADRIDWVTRLVHVDLTREQIRSSPPFDDIGSIDRDYELRLHENYKRQGYWM